MFLDFSTRCGMVTSAMAAQNEITLNGAPYGLAEPCSVSRLLELLNMNGKPVEGEMYKLNHTHYYPRSQLAMTEAEHV